MLTVKTPGANKPKNLSSHRITIPTFVNRYSAIRRTRTFKIYYPNPRARKQPNPPIKTIRSSKKPENEKNDGRVRKENTRIRKFYCGADRLYQEEEIAKVKAYELIDRIKQYDSSAIMRNNFLL